MDLAMIFSERKEYTHDAPLKIVLEKGMHEIKREVIYDGPLGDKVPLGIDGWPVDGSRVLPGPRFLRVTSSNITFLGNEDGGTIVLGGFNVVNQQNVRFEKITVTDGSGLSLKGSETIVEVENCVVKDCWSNGMNVARGATVTATQCEFAENRLRGVSCGNANSKVRLNDCTMHHNADDGLSAFDHAVVDLHGTKTDIRSNKRHGIDASSRAKVNIHLPSQHNTSHGNVKGDRLQEDGGSIANINPDGTFTHVEEAPVGVV
jgi:hypothetical protein